MHIGTGSSGIATANVLRELDCFELYDRADITGDAPDDVRLF
jgi:hypothetical protein